MPRLLAVLAILAAAPAAADSCWEHNDSIMRLHDDGGQRAFVYEVPRQSLAGTGVQPGTMLFIGETDGNSYRGIARVFSSACPDMPGDFPVSGPVLQDPLRVVLTGTRPVWDNCVDTGARRTETLIFTYSHQC